MPFSLTLSSWNSSFLFSLIRLQVFQNIHATSGSLLSLTTFLTCAIDFLLLQLVVMPSIIVLPDKLLTSLQITHLLLYHLYFWYYYFFHDASGNFTTLTRFETSTSFGHHILSTVAAGLLHFSLMAVVLYFQTFLYVTNK